MNKQDKYSATKVSQTSDTVSKWVRPRLIRLNPEATHGGTWTAMSEGAVLHSMSVVMTGSI